MSPYRFVGGNPPATSYVEIAPDRSVSATIDITGAYDLSEPGTYEIAFHGRVHDCTFDAADFPRPSSSLQGMAVSCEPHEFRVAAR
ncbi:MAG: hypothetical protein R3F56_08855 [Planctomycetota bacterium]